MRAGIPLTDEDRAPWLHELADWIGNHERLGRSVVVTCSALKRQLPRPPRGPGTRRSGSPTCRPTRRLLRERLQQRKNHYMPASLLDSQLATLEPLEPDEPGVTVNAAGAPDDVVAEVLAALPPAAAVGRHGGPPRYLRTGSAGPDVARTQRGLGAVGDLQLVEDAAHVVLDRLDRQPEVTGDAGVARPSAIRSSTSRSRAVSPAGSSAPRGGDDDAASTWRATPAPKPRPRPRRSAPPRRSRRRSPP